MRAAESAISRVAALKEVNEHAASLARYASLAVRIEASLLRRLRLQLLPAADASAEADLWFSGLSESRGDEVMVLDAEVSELLRAQLATERMVDNSSALDAVWRHTQDVHASWPESLKLEERLTYLALSQGTAAAPAIEKALQPAMVALASGDKRAVEVARWVIRAMPRLPSVARDAEAAVGLALAAMAVLGTGTNIVSNVKASALPASLAWLVPNTALARRLQLACAVSKDGLHLVTPGGDEPADDLVDFPATRPLMIEVTWRVGDETAQQLCQVKVGELIRLPAGWHDLSLRTLDGNRYAIQPLQVEAGRTKLNDIWPACVRVHVEGAFAEGVFVAPGRVLTALHAVGSPDKFGSVVVEVDGSRWPARVEVGDSRVDLALLLLDAPPSDHPLMPRAQDPPPLGSVVTVLNLIPTGRELVQGTVEKFPLSMNLGDRRHDGLIEVKLPAGVELATGLSGAPLIHESAMVGTVLASNGPDRLLATSIQQIDRFLAWALRPGEHEPFIWISSEGSRDGRSEREMLAIDRIRSALQRARLRPALTRDSSRSKADWTPSEAVNHAEGAVYLVTPEGVPDGSNPLDLVAIAFRRWTNPNFPVALVSVGPEAPHVPSALRDLAPIALESDDSEHLWQALQIVLDGEHARQLPEPNESEFLLAASRALRQQITEPTVSTPFEKLAETVMSAAALAPPGWHEAIESAEFAAMVTLPSGAILQKLREAAAVPPGKRVVVLAAFGVQYARFLLKKAWYPSRPPPEVVIRSYFSTSFQVDEVLQQIYAEVARAIACPVEVVKWLLSVAHSPYVVTLLGPLPPVRVVEGLQASLPGALLLFMTHELAQPSDWEGHGFPMLVPFSDPKDSMLWVNTYKLMLDVVAPRHQTS